MERAAEGYEHRLTAQIELGDIPGARADLAALTKLAADLRQPSQDWFVAVYGALLALLVGAFAEAEHLIATALRLGRRAQSWNAAVSYGLQLYVLRREQGRLDEVEGLVRSSAEVYPTYPIWRCVQAQMAAELGATAEAREMLASLTAEGHASLPMDEEWLVSMGLLAEAASTVGDAEAAAAIYERLVPYGDRVALSYPEISIGPVSRYLGMLATVIGRHDDAERHFEDALELSERIGARPWLAHTQEDYARMLVARDASGDRKRSRELLEAAIAGYRELGMESWAEGASALLKGPAAGTAPSTP